MKFRKVIESGIITAVLALASVTTAVSVSAAEVETGDTAATASIVDHVSQTASTGLQSIQNMNETVQAAATEAEWANRMLVTVDENSWVNIRESATTDSEIVGKFYHASGAEVIEAGEEWTKIKSGDVEGYVKNEFCVFGTDAHLFAEENCDTYATSTADGLRVRQESSTESKIVDVLDAGETIKVDTQAEAVDGWITVECNGQAAYVSADYVETELHVDDAVSIAEEQAKAAREAAAAAAAQTGTTVTTSEAVSASADDTTLLAAIIQCEAGGEPYAGQLAVGAVVMNRVKSGSFPNSISGVIYQSGQFSPASSGKLARVLSSGNISSSCYQAAAEALSGVDNTGGAKYFHAGTSGSGTVIGSQIFY